MTNKPTQADIDKANDVALKLVSYTDTQGRVRNPIAATSLIAQAIADAKAEGIDAAAMAARLAMTKYENVDEYSCSMCAQETRNLKEQGE